MTYFTTRALALAFISMRKTESFRALHNCRSSRVSLVSESTSIRDALSLSKEPGKEVQAADSWLELLMGPSLAVPTELQGMGYALLGDALYKTGRDIAALGKIYPRATQS